MSRSYVLGIDVGTSSTKGVLVDVDLGTVLASATRAHQVDRPRPGWVEMEAQVWWDEFAQISSELLGSPAAKTGKLTGVGISGMGPCVLLTDDQGVPVRPAILYGVDSRASSQIERITAQDR